MSFATVLLEDLIDEPFGMGIFPWDIFPIGYQPRSKKQYGRQHSDNPENRGRRSSVTKDGFLVCLDVQHFTPNEISVQTIKNDVIVEAKHAERADNHGYIERYFKRRYPLPSGYNAKDVISTLSSDGILTIKAPKLVMTEKDGNVREIQIQHTGPAHLYVKGNNKSGAEAEELAKDEVKPKEEAVIICNMNKTSDAQTLESENKENKEKNQPEKEKSENEEKK